MRRLLTRVFSGVCGRIDKGGFTNFVNGFLGRDEGDAKG